MEHSTNSFGFGSENLVHRERSDEVKHRRTSCGNTSKKKEKRFEKNFLNPFELLWSKLVLNPFLENFIERESKEMSDKSVKSSRTDFDKVLKTFVNKAEQQHRLNQNQIENIRRKNRIAGLFFGALVISICKFNLELDIDRINSNF